MSQTGPCGRVTYRWSVGGQAELSAVSSACEPSPSAIVSVGPVLLVSAPSAGLPCLDVAGLR